MVFRGIFGYNKWESVRAVIDGCGRLNASLYDSCMMLIFTSETVQNIYIQLRAELN